MIIKERNQSISHQILRSLDARMELASHEKIQLEAQVKGFDGEKKFDDCFKEVESSGLVIHDLMLSTRDTTYQIDSLYITDNEVTIYEIKNYTGHYIYKNGSIYSDTGFILQDPVAQVNRKQSYLHNLLLSLGYSIKITSYVVFINFNFYIYLLPKTTQIVFAGQLKHHLSVLENSYKPPSSKAKTIADKLLNQQLKNYRPANLPTYTFDQLKKGLYCHTCNSWNCKISKQYLICSDCQFTETISSAVKRTLDEYKLLFPKQRLTLKIAKNWCGKSLSDSRIRRVLSTNYTLKHAGRSSHYI